MTRRRPLEIVGDEVYTGGANRSFVPRAGDGASSSSGSSRRRRSPSQAEQERRKEWGNKWGPLVRDAVAKAIGEAE